MVLDSASRVAIIVVASLTAPGGHRERRRAGRIFE